MDDTAAADGERGSDVLLRAQALEAGGECVLRRYGSAGIRVLVPGGLPVHGVCGRESQCSISKSNVYVGGQRRAEAADTQRPTGPVQGRGWLPARSAFRNMA